MPLRAQPDDAHDTFTRTFNFLQVSKKEVKVQEKVEKVGVFAFFTAFRVSVARK